MEHSWLVAALPALLRFTPLILIISAFLFYKRATIGARYVRKYHNKKNLTLYKKTLYILLYHKQPYHPFYVQPPFFNKKPLLFHFKLIFISIFLKLGGRRTIIIKSL